VKLKAAIAEDEREAAQATTKEEKAKLQAEARVSLSHLLDYVAFVEDNSNFSIVYRNLPNRKKKSKRKAERAERIFLAEETQKKKNLEAKSAAARAVSWPCIFLCLIIAILSHQRTFSFLQEEEKFESVEKEAERVAAKAKEEEAELKVRSRWTFGLRHSWRHKSLSVLTFLLLLLQAIKETEAKAKKEAAAMMRKVCIVMYHKLMCMADIVYGFQLLRLLTPYCRFLFSVILIEIEPSCLIFEIGL
jgi:hypothetical protein